MVLLYGAFHTGTGDVRNWEAVVIHPDGTTSTVFEKRPVGPMITWRSIALSSQE